MIDVNIHNYFISHRIRALYNTCRKCCEYGVNTRISHFTLLTVNITCNGFHYICFTMDVVYTMHDHYESPCVQVHISLEIFTIKQHLSMLFSSLPSLSLSLSLSPSLSFPPLPLFLPPSPSPSPSLSLPLSSPSPSPLLSPSFLFPYSSLPLPLPLSPPPPPSPSSPPSLSLSLLTYRCVS